MKKIAAFGLALLMLFSATACKNDKTTEEEKLNNTNNTLKIHCYAYDTLNPLLNSVDTNMQMLNLIFEGLFICDNSQKAQPVLAENYSVSADGLTWTVNIKNNVKWHDGTVFSAYDVERTFNDILKYKDKSPYFALLSQLELVNAQSNKTVNFKLISPQANFVNLLEVPIVKYHDGEAFSPIGTGPFVYDRAADKTIYLSANKNWHKQKPTTEKVEVKILPDKETSAYAYVSKEIDIVSVNSNEDWDRYSSNADNTIVDIPSNVFNFISINTNIEPLANSSFRQAISYAIDKETICSEVLLSHGSVANSCVNSSWWFYKPDVTAYSYNTEKARETIDKLREKMKIVPINLMVNEDNKYKCRVAEMIKSNLADCGITVYIEYTDWYTFTERVATGNYHMYLGSVKYSADVNPQHVIRNPDATLQTLFNQLQIQTTEKGIKDKYYTIQEKIAKDLQIIPLYFDISSIMYNKRIEGEYQPYRSNIFNSIENIKLNK